MGTRTPAITTSYTLRQHHRNSNCKQNCKKTKIQKYGNAIILHSWSRQTWGGPSRLEPGKIKYIVLCIKTPWHKTSLTGYTNKLKLNKLTSNVTTGYKSQCCERACWKYIRRMRTWPPPPHIRINHDYRSMNHNTSSPSNVTLIGTIPNTHEIM